MINTGEIQLTPIGQVRNKVKKPLSQGWGGIQSEIVLYDEFLECIQGLEGFSHLIVVFWMHLVDETGRTTKRTNLSINKGQQIELGVLATRTQARPNPIGVAVVRLMEQKGSTLSVEQLDAIDGTPVLDIKPYLPPYDSFPNALMPGWATGKD
ncbi:MAG: tRNA (N6-threonylcarbamoyladenosine(37)-N6)-methyltransferase TrmO [Dehalococcoidia bacterium]|nr:tRNA (N6-threonylcarbamoyladenosine(37)-N6)-methyltransferase TrmO [Dehalococcoidia bacterium]